MVAVAAEFTVCELVEKARVVMEAADIPDNDTPSQTSILWSKDVIVVILKLPWGCVVGGV